MRSPSDSQVPAMTQFMTFFISYFIVHSKSSKLYVLPTPKVWLMQNLSVWIWKCILFFPRDLESVSIVEPSCYSSPHAYTDTLFDCSSSQRMARTMHVIMATVSLDFLIMHSLHTVISLFTYLFCVCEFSWTSPVLCPRIYFIGHGITEFY